MSSLFSEAVGRKVISRASAEELGKIAHLVVDPGQGRVTALVIGPRKKASLLDWSDISGFGPDAVIVRGEESLRRPGNERERAAAGGKLELVGKRGLNSEGNELGKVSDVEFDPETGSILGLWVGERRLSPHSLLGVGSYAVVLTARDERGQPA